MKKQITIIFAIICILLFSSVSCYATVDITPPTGSITLNQVVNNSSNPTVTIGIVAEDDVSSGSGIEFYISTSTISGSEIIPDDDWEPYSTGVTKDVTLAGANGNVYLILRDEAGNTSIVFNGGNAEYEIAYNTNGGSSLEISGTARAYFGCPFIVTSRVPTKTYCDFLGWSTNPNATVASYAPDDIISASVFKGVNHNITLYAIWREPIDEATTYVGYYADVDGDGNVDGIIYADLAVGVSARWGDGEGHGSYSYNKKTGLKYYTIDGEATSSFGTKGVIREVAGTTGADRFYVMALEDFEDGNFTWYRQLKKRLNTEQNFGTGKQNTIKMITAWNSAEGGPQTTTDLWGAIQDGQYDIVTTANDSKKWFIPSRAEWVAFGGNLGITTSNRPGLNGSYFSSSEYDIQNAYNVYFGNGCYMTYGRVYNGYYFVRLSTTF